MKKLKDPKKYFYTANGMMIRSLKEMPSVLARMPQDVYNYHVNPAKNDFSNWIRDVFNMPGLAKEIQRARREEMIRKVKEALKVRPVGTKTKRRIRRKKKRINAATPQINVKRLSKEITKTFKKIMLT